MRRESRSSSRRHEFLFGALNSVLPVVVVLCGAGVSTGAEIGLAGGLATDYSYAVTDDYRASFSSAWFTGEVRSATDGGAYVGVGGGHVWYRKPLIVSSGAPYQPEQRIDMYPLAGIVGFAGRSRYHRSTSLRAELWLGAAPTALSEWNTTDDQRVGDALWRWRPLAMGVLAARHAGKRIEVGARVGLLYADGLGFAQVGNFTDDYYPNVLQLLFGLEVALTRVGPSE